MSESIQMIHVDDEPDFADLTADILESEDHRFIVETARNAEAGLNELESGVFDCIVSDYDRPGELTSRTPISFITRERRRSALD